MGAPVDDAFEDLAGLAARGQVIDKGDDVRFLVAAQQKRAVETATRALAGAAHRDLVPQSAAAEQ